MHIARCTCTLEPWLSELSELSDSSVGLSDIVGHYRFSAASLHNCMPDSFSLVTYHLEPICEDTQSWIFELCSSRGGLRFRRAAISSTCKWERRVGDRGADPLPFDNNFTKERPTDSLVGGSHLRGGVTGVSIVLSCVPDAPHRPFHQGSNAHNKIQ